ncbi:DUF6279 family lipoprotein [Vibrio sp. LaRot3]|uniref:DUF6279 family lipoprotein n=1 Tax=Vibrio sp. LaRot3 TaxID=2998829 RepID=UPI0022CDCB90|nr:DUF6279 family lipoprotein [Vibrio sp. LaRot3]MDA0148503.1 DUF6279 family lipoprotein [Vibrio sp. LaRot3]
MTRRLLILMLSLVLFGCGSRFVYDNLDWFVLQYIDEFVELNDQQEQLIKSSLNDSIEWHRGKEVPQYLAQLKTIQLSDPRNVTDQFLLSQERQLREHSTRLLDKFYPAIVQLVAKLNDEQAEQLMDAIRVKHIKVKSKYGSLDEQEIRDLYQQRIEENLTDWIGRLNTNQKQLIEQWVAELQVTTPLWLNYQTNLRIELKTILAQRTSSEKLEQGLHALLYNPEQYYGEPLASAVKHNKQVGRKYMILMGRSMSEKQIEHWRDELQDWIDIATDVEKP